MHGDSGEFFSPDYLCSNPPLWCNWTIQVPAGKRVHIQLEDFTLADSCHLKTDQIHLDESPGAGLSAAVTGETGDHRILEKCWRKAEYTSHSSTVHVILLITRTPNPPLRGFYGRFKSLGGLPGTQEALNDRAGMDDASNSNEYEKQEPSDVHHNHGKTEPLVPDSVSVQVGYSPSQNPSPTNKTAGGHLVSPAPTPMSNKLPSGPRSPEGEGSEKASATWKTIRGHGEGGGGGGGEGGGEGEEEEEEEGLEFPLRHSPDANSVMAEKKADRPHADSPSTVTSTDDPESGLKVNQARGRSSHSEGEVVKEDEYPTFITQSPVADTLQNIAHSPSTEITLQDKTVTTTTTTQREVVKDPNVATNIPKGQIPKPKVQAAKKPGIEANYIGMKFFLNFFV